MLGIKSYIKVTSNTYYFKEHAFLKNKYKTIIKSLTNKYISGIIVLNSGIADYYKSAGINPNKIYKIPNGVNISKFKPQISQLGEKAVNNQLWNALYVGGLTYGKGIIELTESLKYLKEAGLSLNLRLVGPDRTSGKITKQIEYITKRDKTENMIKLYGHQNNPNDFFQLSEIFILPTHSEGMSNALLEAISAGLYCIVTDIDGNSDIIKNGINGIFTNGTPQDIADKIAFAINDKKFNYICTNARKTAINKFNSESILNSYFNLLINNRFDK
jgi:glycosyltransferase involved in cell wall biosynthesis